MKSSKSCTDLPQSSITPVSCTDPVMGLRKYRNLENGEIYVSLGHKSLAKEDSLIHMRPQFVSLYPINVKTAKQSGKGYELSKLKNVCLNISTFIIFENASI